MWLTGGDVVLSFSSMFVSKSEFLERERACRMRISRREFCSQYSNSCVIIFLLLRMVQGIKTLLDIEFRSIFIWPGICKLVKQCFCWNVETLVGCSWSFWSCISSIVSMTSSTDTTCKIDVMVACALCSLVVILVFGWLYCFLFSDMIQCRSTEPRLPMPTRGSTTLFPARWDQDTCWDRIDLIWW